MKYKKNCHLKNYSFSKIFLLVCIIGVTMTILLELIYMIKINKKIELTCSEKPKYWVYSSSIEHVHSVLETVGFEKSTNKTPWNLLWSVTEPLAQTMRKLQPHQKVNQMPGTYYLEAKVILATTNSSYIPKAFQLPKSKKEFFEYSKKKKTYMFLEKSNSHRGISLKYVNETDWSSGNKFVQQYVEKPFLVDGHKFDIGVYVVITSVDPLRAYWYKGDVLMRYCHLKYYPFDHKILKKYVLGVDYYLPTWEVPSLAQLFNAHGYGMKDSFDIYVRSIGKDPSIIWEEVQKAIADVMMKKAPLMAKTIKGYPSQDNFFEMMRFDLIVDEDFKVYVLEANMSPNLDSTHFKQNAVLYEQVLYNTFSLAGISHKPTRNNDGAEPMVSAEKNIAAFGEQCATVCFNNCEAMLFCQLCKPCLDHKLSNSLLKAHTEFLHRGDFRRLVPPSMRPKENATELPESLSKETFLNKLQHMWYQEKCNQDLTWCY